VFSQQTLYSPERPRVVVDDKDDISIRQKIHPSVT
jgi:hypothetical protein